MTLKELVRAAICGEMEDISACEVDAEVFNSGPVGEKAAALYGRLVEEKKARLLDLGRIFKEGTGFRQRNIPASRSIEASLRARAARAEKASVVYAGLMRVLNKPEFKEAMKVLAERERALFAEIKELQSLKK